MILPAVRLHSEIYSVLIRYTHTSAYHKTANSLVFDAAVHDITPQTCVLFETGFIRKEKKRKLSNGANATPLTSSTGVEWFALWFRSTPRISSGKIMLTSIATSHFTITLTCNLFYRGLHRNPCYGESQLLCRHELHSNKNTTAYVANDNIFISSYQ